MNSRYITLLFVIFCTTISTIPNAPRSFGKTHFIVGMQPQELVRVQSEQPNPSPTCHAYFSPDDNLESLLCSYIDQEQEAIDIAIFSFTNKRIARALIDAYNRGIKIRIITDPSSLQDRFNKCTLLQENHIPIFVYDLHYKGKASNTLSNLMHNKFAIFKKNNGKIPCVWTGSFNFTKSASLSNQENILVIQEQPTVQKYIMQFDRLLQRCKKK